MTIDDRLQRAAQELRSQTERLPLPEARSRPSRSRRRPVVAFAATTALALVAAMLTIVATRGGEEEPAGAGSWEKVPFEETGFEPGTYVSSVVEGGPGLVAAGYVEAAELPVSPEDLLTGGFIDGRIWTSREGRRWERTDADAFRGMQLGPVIDTPHGVLVFGRPVIGESGTSVWRSRGGTDWELLTAEAPSIGDVVLGGPGLVAAGSDTEADGFRTAIWTSTDGASWARVPGGEKKFPSGVINGLARNDHGFVAFGFQFEFPDQIEEFDQSAPEPLLWTSSDGVMWERVRGGAGLGNGAAVPTIAVVDDRFLTFSSTGETTDTTTTTTTTTTTVPQSSDDGGSSSTILVAAGPGVDAAFESDDGARWRRWTRGELPFEAPSQLISAHNRLLVVDVTGTAESSRAAVYSSGDGRRWELAVKDPPSEPGELYSPTAMSATKKGAVVVLGDFSRTSERGPDAWVWTAP